jgi:hypothetical protein
LGKGRKVSRNVCGGIGPTKKGIISTNSQQKTLCLFSNLMQYLPVVAVVERTGVLSNRGELGGGVLLMMATTCKKREEKTKQLAGGNNGEQQTREFQLAQRGLAGSGESKLARRTS